MPRATQYPPTTDNTLKYGCSNDGFMSGAYRCRFCGCKQYKAQQLAEHEYTCKLKLVKQLQFMLREDYAVETQAFNTANDDDNIFNIMKSILIKNNLSKPKNNNICKVKNSKPELVYTSTPINYKKSEDLIPLNKPVESDVETLNNRMKLINEFELINEFCKSDVETFNETLDNRIKLINEFESDVETVNIVEPTIDITDSPISYDSDTETINEVVKHKTKVITNINILESDSDDDNDDITIYAVDPTLKHLTDEDYDNIREICLDYTDTTIPFYIVLKNFNNENNKITYLHIVNSDKLEFQMISMNEDMIVDNDYVINRNRYMSGINSNYYEIEYDLDYDIHSE
jgi:hypothetical protein